MSDSLYEAIRAEHLAPFTSAIEALAGGSPAASATSPTACASASGSAGASTVSTAPGSAPASPTAPAAVSTAAACVVASTLPQQARDALLASFARLGYAAGDVVFIDAAKLDGPNAASDTRAEGSAPANVTTTTPTGGLAVGASPNAAVSPSVTADNPKPTENPAALDPRVAEALFTVLEALDPLCVVLCDLASVKAASRAYNTPLPLNARTQLLGRAACCFEDFPAMLATSEGKQRAWALLKQL